MKVGYLGPKGTFSYEICNKVFDESYEKIPFKTIKDTIIALENSKIDRAIVPVENSLQGCVTETIDCIIEISDIEICAEKVLKINQNLMAKENYNLCNITELYSHPQALAQCRNYIENNLKNAEIIEVSSTALAAKEVSNKENAACICNIECAKEYNLTLLEKEIQDNNFNETKFIVLKKVDKEEIEFNKLSMVFATKHEPGALYKALGIFNKYGLNLTKIESRPAKTKLGEYYFIVDVDIENKNYIKAIEELKNIVTFYKVLGRYTKE